MAINLINKIKVFVKTRFKYESKFNKKKLEAIKVLEEYLNEINLIECYINSEHGINMKFTLNANKLDLSKNHPDYFIFYDKEGIYSMDYNKKRNDFCLSHNKMWSKLKKDFELSAPKIKNIMKEVLEKKYKHKINKVYGSINDYI